MIDWENLLIVFSTLHPLLFSLTSIPLALGDVIANTDKGQVRGFSDYPNGKHVDTFLGIPFATPPLGDLRYKPPLQLDPWTGVWDATKFPNSCMQTYDLVFGNFTGSTMWNANTELSEDCLYLNVWVPRTNPPYQNKSVLVWIYGGGFYYGSSTLDVYNANILAAENDIIVVSMQYRVGSFGFLALDTQETPGNAGLWDQRMALEWVSRNIHQFGGNPHSVTIMGESAGAVSVGLHLLCDVCRAYFHKAILQSGGPGVKWGVLAKEEIWRRSRHLASHVGCPKDGDHRLILKCLRSKNASDFPDQEVFTAQGIIQMPFVPVVDGVFIRRNPSEMLERGMFKKIPILLGSNENEGFFFALYQTDAFSRDHDSLISSEDYRIIMEDYFKYYPHYPHMLNHFGREAIIFNYVNWVNPNDKVSLRDAIDKAVGDAFFVCSMNQLARAYAERDNPVFYYWFAERWSANPWPKWMGVLHADEIWFTFGHPFNNSHSFTEPEKKLSRKMMIYWTNFAKTGDPNIDAQGGSLMEWPRFRHDEQLYMNLSSAAFETGNTWGQGPRTQHCAFWDHYLPKLVAETSQTIRTCNRLKESYYAIQNNAWTIHWSPTWLWSSPQVIGSLLCLSRLIS